MKPNFYTRADILRMPKEEFYHLCNYKDILLEDILTIDIYSNKINMKDGTSINISSEESAKAIVNAKNVYDMSKSSIKDNDTISKTLKEVTDKLTQTFKEVHEEQVESHNRQLEIMSNYVEEMSNKLTKTQTKYNSVVEEMQSKSKELDTLMTKVDKIMNVFAKLID